MVRAPHPIEVIYNLDGFAMTKSYQDGRLLASYVKNQWNTKLSLLV